MPYLHQVCYQASPKAISGRTSYLRVRLEFLPYPQLITTLFNGCVFGPPQPFTAASSWSWVGHPVSGPYIPTCALFTLGLPSARSLKNLTSPVYMARRTVLQKVHGCTLVVLPQLVDTGFQVLFHSPPGVLFTVPSRYYPLSVTKEYLALRGGPRTFIQGFSCLVLLWILLCFLTFTYGTFTLFGWSSQYHSVWLVSHVRSPNPGMQAFRFGLLRVRSPLLAESLLFSLPPAT